MPKVPDGPGTTSRSDLRLQPDDLRRTCDPRTLEFDTTAAVEPTHGAIGQPRALNAIEFGP